MDLRKKNSQYNRGHLHHLQDTQYFLEKNNSQLGPMTLIGILHYNINIIDIIYTYTYECVCVCACVHVHIIFWKSYIAI